MMPLKNNNKPHRMFAFKHRVAIQLGILLCACFLARVTISSAGLSTEPYLDGLWGRGWIWLDDDGQRVCSGTLCQSLYRQPAPTPTPIRTPSPSPAEPTPVPDARGQVPLKGQTKYVSCELRTTANNVEWYYRYRLNREPAEMLPAGFTDWEAFFISRAGQNCNPNRGFRGDVNGKFVTACDANAGGYGIYPRAIEASLDEIQVPYRTLYLDLSESSTEQLQTVFLSSYENNQVLSLWVRQIVDAPITWEIDPETGERYPIVTHEHAVSGQVFRAADGSYLMRVIDPWPMYTGLEYEMRFEDLMGWMRNMGIYMLQVIG